MIQRVEIEIQIHLHSVKGPILPKMAKRGESLPCAFEFPNTLRGSVEAKEATDTLEQYLGTEVFPMYALCTAFGIAGTRLARSGVPLPINSAFYPFDEEGKQAALQGQEALQNYCNKYVIPRGK